jgi:apolipoprotein N-acyltransferase
MKNNYLLAISSGLLLALGWPTYGFPILLFIAFVPLLIAEKKIRTSGKKRTGLKIFIAAYSAFVLWNAITTWWLWYSTVFGMFFAILANALLMSILFLGYHYTAKKLPGKIHLLFLPALWLAFEKFHLSWAFSWPWLNLGNAFSEHTHWIQWYEYTGTLGGSLWIWVVNIGIFKTLERYHAVKNKKIITIGIAKNVLIIAIPIAISLIFLKTDTAPKDTVNVVVLQPNVDPYSEKYYTPNAEAASKLFALADEKADATTNFIIAPETVFARSIEIKKFEHTSLKHTIKNYIRKNNTINFLSGISFIHWIDDKNDINKQSNRYNDTLWYNDYNSAFLINRTDSIQYYHKSKLVVGVETFPFKSILEPLMGNMMLDLGGTVATKVTQKERSVFTSFDHKFKAAPIICYESVYGEFVNGYIKKGANFLAIITNDGWWSNTQGHKQHLSYAKLRAIETRRSIARSANTGISALIDQNGTVISALPYSTKGALKGAITLNDKITFYTKYGDYIGRLAFFVAALLFLFSLAKRKNNSL